MDAELAEEILQRPFREYVQGLTPEECISEMRELLRVIFEEDLIEMIPEDYMTFVIGKDALLDLQQNFELPTAMENAIEAAHYAVHDNQVLELEMYIYPFYDPNEDEISFEYYVWYGNTTLRGSADHMEEPGMLSSPETVSLLERVLRLGHSVLNDVGERVSLRTSDRAKSARK